MKELLDVLKAMAEDRREQTAMFYEMLNKQNEMFTTLLTRQAEALNDSEKRIGNINAMVNNLFSIVSSKEKEEANNSSIADQAMKNNASLQGELHKLVALLEERSREEVIARKQLDEITRRLVEQRNHAENVINVNKNQQ